MRAGGYFICTTEEGVVGEGDTFTCCHCQRVIQMKPKAKRDPNEVGWCTLCFKPQCKGCENLPCVPFERKLETIEGRARLLQSVG